MSTLTKVKIYLVVSIVLLITIIANTVIYVINVNAVNFEKTSVQFLLIMGAVMLILLLMKMDLKRIKEEHDTD